MKISDLVEKYIDVRDKKAQYKAEADAKITKFDDALAKMEAALLKVFETTGMESVKTEFGTAYTSSRNTASIASPDEFMAFCKAHDAWHMLQKRVSVAAIEQYKDEHQDVPPGINWRVERTVNIRRS